MSDAISWPEERKLRPKQKICIIENVLFKIIYILAKIDLKAEPSLRNKNFYHTVGDFNNLIADYEP